VVELKAGAFAPAHAGQLNSTWRRGRPDQSPGRHPTIGLLLCKTKNQLVAEYALSGMAKPMGVAEYQLLRALPEPLRHQPANRRALEEELNAGLKDENKTSFSFYFLFSFVVLLSYFFLFWFVFFLLSLFFHFSSPLFFIFSFVFSVFIFLFVYFSLPVEFLWCR